MSFSNPLSQAAVSLNAAPTVTTLRNGAPIQDLRLRGQSQTAIASNGEFNAGSVNELKHMLTAFMDECARGNIVQQPANMATASNADKQKVLYEALHDPAKWVATGAAIAAQIYEQANRDGFMRNLCLGNTLKQGEDQRIPMLQHDVFAVVATSGDGVGIQQVRSKQFRPDEFELIANVYVSSLDIEQTAANLLDHAYNEGLQSLIVKEDSLWKKAADTTVGSYNDINYIVGDLTPRNLGDLRYEIDRWKIPASTALIAADFWKDIIGSNDFATSLDPITKYDLAMNGRLGTLYGINLITDGFRQSNMRVLNEGEMYFVAEPQYHGGYSTRGGVRSTPTDRSAQGSTDKGWLLSEFLSLQICNMKSVAKAQRLR